MVSTHQIAESSETFDIDGGRMYLVSIMHPYIDRYAVYVINVWHDSKIQTCCIASKDESASFDASENGKKLTITPSSNDFVSIIEM